MYLLAIDASARGGLMLADFPIFGGFDKDDDVTFNPEDLVNLYLRVDENGKKKFAFAGTPGLKFEQTVKVGTEPARALYVPDFEQDAMYGVFGDTVYKFTTLLVATSLGTIGTDTGYVSIAANNANQIIFVDGQDGYLYDVNSGVFSDITDPDFPASPINVAFLDGYFVVADGESREFQISALNDGTKWDALDEAQIQAYSGYLLGVGVVNRRLYFFKTDSTEVWFNQGAADFPFRRDNNLIFNYGCLATSSIVSEFGFLFWLGSDANGVGSVFMTTGQEPQRISTPAVENLIASFDAPSDVACYVYKDDGHLFYVMNWTTDDYTLVYDSTTKKWHRMTMLQSKAVSGQPYSAKTRHIANCLAYFNGQHYIGSYKESKLYSFSRDYADNAGEVISRVRVPKIFFDPGYRLMQVNKFQLDIHPGVGANDGTYKAPKIYLSVSRNGGITFGNEKPAGMGRIGQYLKRTIWWRLGICRSFTPKITLYASVAPVLILGAAIDYEVIDR
jgi:hypothetical protein